MATATRRPTNSEAEPAAPPPPAIPKRKANGRTAPQAPPSEDDSSFLPPSIHKLAEGEDFWEYLSRFSSDQWSNLIGYLWRVAPIHDRKFAGKPTAIGKYAKSFDVETVKVDHGSGGYRIDLCYIRPDGGGSKRIAQWYFQIMDMQHPPMLPNGEWLNDPQNADWKWAQPKIAARDAVTPPDSHQQDAASLFQTVLAGVQSIQGDRPDNNQMAVAVLDMVSRNQDAMMALNDPGRQLSTLQQLIALAKTHDNGDGAKPYEMIISLLRDDLKATRQEVAQLRADTAGRKDLLVEVLENLPRIKEAAQSLGFGRSAGTAGTDWGMVITTAVDKLSNHVPGILDAITRKNQQPRRVAANTQATQAEPQEEPMSQHQEILTKWQATIEQAAPFLIDHFRAELGGTEFQNWFTSRFGSLAWGTLRDDLAAGAPGAEPVPDRAAAVLTELAMAHPHLRTVLQPREQLLLFLKDFFAPFAPEGEEEENALTA